MAIVFIGCGVACAVSGSISEAPVAKVEAPESVPAWGSQKSVLTSPYKTPAMLHRVTDSVALDTCFRAEEIDDSTFARMKDKSWKRNCTLKRSDLRYLRLLHNDANGQTRQGEMVVHKAIADKVVLIMRELYEAGYRIERLELVDNYGADDTRSIDFNNSSSFNFRTVGGTNRLSRHARGLSIDLNPLYNPYITYPGGKPKTHRPKWAFDRDTRSDVPYKIDHDDLAFKLFIREGFTWGGDWNGEKDYQHFDYKIPSE